MKYVFLLVIIVLISNYNFVKPNEVLNQRIDEIIERDYLEYKNNNKISSKLLTSVEKNENLQQINSTFSKDGNLPSYKCQHETLMKNRKIIQKSETHVENKNNSSGSSFVNNVKLQLKESSTSGKIRFYFDTTYLFNQVDTHACQSVGQEIVIGGSNAVEICNGQNNNACLYTCTEKSLLGNQLANLINNTLLNTIGNILSSFVNVRDQQDHLKLVPTYQDDECDYDYKIPSKYFNTGVDNSDMIIFVTSRPTLDTTTIAYAMICSFKVSNSGKYGRPLGATINFNPIYFQDFINSPSGSIYKQYVRVGLHEMIHALGFSGNYYSSFTDQNGDYYKTVPGSKLVISGSTPSDQSYSYERQVIKTPTVSDFVKKHYDCDSIDFMELEDYGSSGTAGSHWEKRTAGEDLMIGFVQPVFLITNLTLSLLEDTGFYNIDFSKAEMLNWGKNLGCSWLKTCDKNSWDYPGYFCESTQYSCTPTRTGKGICGVAKYSNIPLYYQHFDDESMGGLDEQSDLCPYSAVLSQYNSKSYYCIHPENQNLADNNIFEKFGENSRCFEYQTFFGGQGIGCYQQRCSGETLQIEIDEKWFDCPEGKTISNNGVTIDCPLSYYPCLPVGVSPPERSSSNNLSINVFFIFVVFILILT